MPLPSASFLCIMPKTYVLTCPLDVYPFSENNGQIDVLVMFYAKLSRIVHANRPRVTKAGVDQPMQQQKVFIPSQPVHAAERQYPYFLLGRTQDTVDVFLATNLWPIKTYHMVFMRRNGRYNPYTANRKILGAMSQRFPMITGQDRI
jgi:hypothetical protein